jgi:DNA-binding NarL/FixJ family response regulator
MQSATSRPADAAGGDPPCAALVSARHSEQLAELIEAHGIRVYPFASVEELIDAPRVSLSSVVLLLEASDSSPVVEIETLGEHFEQAPVVLVSSDLPRWKVRRALVSGAAGIVFEEEARSALGPCVCAVLAGQVCVPSRNREQIEPPVLSTREKQILGLVVMGYMNGQIAQQLFLAESTVKSHLSSAFAKLGVRSRNEAVELIVDPEQGLGVGILALVGEPLATERVLDGSALD